MVEAVVGPIPRPSRGRLGRAGRRAALQEHANAAISAAGLDGHTWVPEWLDQLRRRRLPAALIEQATTILGLTVGAHAGTWSRGELAKSSRPARTAWTTTRP